MKTIKIAITALFVSALMVLPSNSVEVRIGISAGYAQLEASGTETLKDSSVTTSTTEQANAVIPSMFAELSMDNGLGIGYDLIAGSADLTGSTKNTVDAIKTGTYREAVLESKSPMDVGLCTYDELEKSLNRSRKKVESTD